MAAEDTMSSFWRGLRDGLPFLIVVGPFAMLFGVLATEAGLAIHETMGFSVVVIAGAAQFTALQLMNENAPTLVIIASALAVNLRMAMYSASLTPYLGGARGWVRVAVAYFTVDQSYACSVTAYEENPDWALPQKLAFFFGVATPVVPVWVGSTIFGVLAGARVPDSWALDFAIPITFIAIVAPILRTRAHRAAALTGIVASLMLTWMPYSSGVIAAGFIGMAVGAELERRTPSTEGVR